MGPFLPVKTVSVLVKRWYGCFREKEQKMSQALPVTVEKETGTIYEMRIRQKPPRSAYILLWRATFSYRGPCDGYKK